MRPHWMGNVWKKCGSYHWFWLYALMYSAKVIHVFLCYWSLSFLTKMFDIFSGTSRKLKWLHVLPDDFQKTKTKQGCGAFFFQFWNWRQIYNVVSVFWDAARGHIGSLTTSLPIWLIKVQKVSLHTKADVFTVSVAELSSKRKRHHHKCKMHYINKHWFPYVYWFIEIILHNKRKGRQMSSLLFYMLMGGSSR